MKFMEISVAGLGEKASWKLRADMAQSKRDSSLRSE